MRNIYLIRHGRPEFPGGEKCCIGWTDLPLSQEGINQMKNLRAEFEHKEIERIYSSPLKRCVQSAQIISNGKIPIEIVEDMKEICMGQWEGISFSKIKEQYPAEYEKRGRDISRYSPPGGESFSQCQIRAKRVLKKIQEQTRGNVILLSHAGFNRTLITDFEGRRLNRLLEIPQEYGGVYTYQDFIFDGMIVAAGMSSRMGEFKPLMNLGGKPIISRQLHTLKNGGVREIAVITGNRAQELKAAVEDDCVKCLYNPDYAHTKMFDSVRIGLEYFLKKIEKPEGKSLDGIFFLPVDVPLFTRFTMEYEKQKFIKGEGDVYCPYYSGAPGHPLLIRGSAIKKLLEHDGERGLKGAYEKLGEKVVHLDVTDKGAVMDADTQEDFESLEQYIKEREIPDEKTCLHLLSWFHVGDGVMRHSKKVAELAVNMAKACNENGAQLNISLIRSAALLHDVAKGRENHAETAALWLAMLGHCKTAEVVEDHMDLPKKKQDKLNESLIVYLADKMIKEEKHVSIEERFASKRELFQGNQEAMEALERRYCCAKHAEQIVKEGISR